MRVKVTLRDASTSEAVPFAYAAVRNGDTFTTVAQADGDGVLFFDHPTGNTVELKVSTIGYKDSLSTFTADGTPRVVDMVSTDTELAPVVVERERPKVPVWVAVLAVGLLLYAASDE